ncbi:YhjD/YihY/BrkB family envelope integrity protein [Mycoplasma nasistruthionis]|uniref:YihY/virulence factor BrkB family protein n=1 Tax=Mycoplasma nasistruthionis TaxID=353852 RepID=A0A4Y6I5Q6_9MOLU|nr:YhjD/YihY/BrkB family envelope integrity protein [Mycoplasma nasistruthionis]QCZ36660.1 hypothetical protein FG904_01340 [Mycoplasma nasistruthionis]QDF64954.1 hypothetical protein FIV53_01360 [Mycoplasma nasistruthionis]
MNFLNKNKPTDYKKLISLKNKRKKFKNFHSNLIFPDRFLIVEKIYQFIVKDLIISFFAFILLYFKEAKSPRKRRKKVIDTVYARFVSKEYNFIWLSTAFYLLVSFVPVIYIVYLINLFLSNMDWYNNAIGSEYQNYFFNLILGRFLAGANNYLGEISISLSKTDELSWHTLLPWLLLFLSALYISSSGYEKLVSANNYIYDHYKIGTYWGNKFKGLLLVLFVAFWLWFISTLDILIEKQFVTIVDNNIQTSFANNLIYIIFTIIFFYTLMLGLFKFAPSFKNNFSYLNKGAILAAVPIILLVLLFQTINSYFSYSKFGSVVGFFLSIAFFINWFAYFMFLGITFNDAYYKNYISARTINKKSLFL